MDEKNNINESKDLVLENTPEEAKPLTATTDLEKSEKPPGKTVLMIIIILVIGITLLLTIFAFFRSKSGANPSKSGGLVYDYGYEDTSDSGRVLPSETDDKVASTPSLVFSEEYEDINEISIIAKKIGVDVEFIETTEKKLKVDYYSIDGENTVILDRPSALEITVPKDSSKSVFSYFTASLTSAPDKFIIHIPKGTEFVFVKISTQSGLIIINDLYIRNLELEVFSGEIEASGLEGQSAEISFSSGDVNLADLKYDTANIEFSSGDFSLKKCDFQKSLDIKLTSGNMELGTVFADKASIKMSSGLIEGEDINFNGLDFKMTSGTVFLDGIFRGRSDIQASSGSIKFVTQGPVDIFDYDLRLTSGTFSFNGKKLKENYIINDDKENSISIAISSGTVDLRIL